MSAAPPPNWYPDPVDAAQLRWWDGSQWTDHRHALVPAAPTVTVETPQPAASVETPQPAASAEAPRPAGAVGSTPPVVGQWAAARTPEPQAPTAASPPATVFDLEPRTPAPGPDLETVQPAGQAFEPAPAAQSWRPQEHTWAAPVPVPMNLPGPGTAPAKDRKPVMIGAAVIAVLLIGVIAFAVTRGGDDSGDIISQTPSTTGAGVTTASAATVAPTTVAAVTTRPAATSVATTAGSTLAGTTFSDATNVYRLRVAPTWQDATVVGGLQTWSTGTSSSVFRDSVNVLIEKLPGDISMDDYLAASVRNAPKSLPSFVEVGRSVSTVNGKVLGQLDFRSNQNIPLRHRAVVLIKGRNAIVVTYTIEPARFDAEVVKVQPYLTSVEAV